MKTAEINRKALAHCEFVRYCDDRLGRYSDHEGDENGPTFHLWQKGDIDFEMHCLRAIEDHKKAITVWRKFLRLNAKRFKEPK